MGRWFRRQDKDRKKSRAKSEAALEEGPAAAVEAPEQVEQSPRAEIPAVRRIPEARRPPSPAAPPPGAPNSAARRAHRAEIHRPVGRRGIPTQSRRRPTDRPEG